MIHRQLIVLIIGISLSSIHGSLFLDGFRANEKYIECGWEYEATCKNKTSSDNWVCGESRRICAYEWLVRSDEDGCVRAWQCPDICPPQSQFNGCATKLDPFSSIKAAEFTEQCEPVCICEKGCIMNRNKTKCLCLVSPNIYRPPVHGR